MIGPVAHVGPLQAELKGSTCKRAEADAREEELKAKLQEISDKVPSPYFSRFEFACRGLNSEELCSPTPTALWHVASSVLTSRRSLRTSSSSFMACPSESTITSSTQATSPASLRRLRHRSRSGTP